jgi:hypothetical protein
MVFMVILLVFVILVAIKDIQGLMKNESWGKGNQKN